MLGFYRQPSVSRISFYFYFSKWDIVFGQRWSEVAGVMGTLTRPFQKRPLFFNLCLSHIFILTFSDRRRKRIANLFYGRRNRETSDFITTAFLYEWMIFFHRWNWDLKFVYLIYSTFEINLVAVVCRKACSTNKSDIDMLIVVSFS